LSVTVPIMISLHSVEIRHAGSKSVWLPLDVSILTPSCVSYSLKFVIAAIRSIRCFQVFGLKRLTPQRFWPGRNIKVGSCDAKKSWSMKEMEWATGRRQLHFEPVLVSVSCDRYFPPATTGDSMYPVTCFPDEQPGPITTRFPPFWSWIRCWLSSAFVCGGYSHRSRLEGCTVRLFGVP